jgi:hypothetical protein
MNVAYLVAVIIILLVIAFFTSTLLFRRAVKEVVSAFRKHEAISGRNAKTIAELDLAPTSFFSFSRRGLRDYKPHALQLLMTNDIIRATKDGKLYLSEDKLADSRFRQ